MKEFQKTILYKHSRGDTRIVFSTGARHDRDSLSKMLNCKETVFVSDRKVYGLWGRKIFGGENHQNERIILLPEKEKAKTFFWLKKILDMFHKLKVDRKSRVVAMGGGAVTDVVSLASSIYRRGVPLTLIPTTLLAQVDAAIGGKNGINYSGVKNIIGNFYQPDNIIIENDFLSTLDKREISSGSAEIFKYALLQGQKGVDRYSKSPLVQGEFFIDRNLRMVIYDAVKYKVDLVIQDEFDNMSKRIFLNLGHTIGHAIESCGGLVRITHGEAVALGLLAASYISLRKKLITLPYFRKIVKCVEKSSLPLSFQTAKVDKIVNFMRYDKKNEGQNPVFVLPTNSKARIVRDISFDYVSSILKEMKNHDLLQL